MHTKLLMVLTSHLPFSLHGLVVSPWHCLHDGPYVFFGQQTEQNNNYVLSVISSLFNKLKIDLNCDIIISL
jgi:hypothetical protein